MDQHRYFIPKVTGTLSDDMVAFGAATVLHNLVQAHVSGGRVTLQDRGSFYVVDTDEPIQESWIDNYQDQVIPFATTGGKFEVPGDLMPAAARNVDDEWDTFRRYREQWEQLRQEKKANNEIEHALSDQKPRPDWTVVTYLGDYRMQAQGIHNSLVEQWVRTNQQFPGLNLRTILALFASPNADWDAIAAEWKSTVKGSSFSDSVTASQLFNPHMGKGQNRTKANKLTMGNEKVFWLLEFLKAVGLWSATVPTRVTNADVRKTYTIAPRELEMDFHRKVLTKFRDRLWNEGAVKQDIVAALLYAEVLLEQSIEDDAVDVFDNGGISNVVNGMEVASYQLLSANSYTMMNLSFLGLPDWMPNILSTDDARSFIVLLQEHRERIRAIDGDRSEGYGLLQIYRDFLSGNYFTPFFEFLGSYSSYLMNAIDRSNFFVKPFSETNLRRLFGMATPQLTPILEDEGFRNVAYAIRMSTLVPLYMGRNKSRFDIRYGLGQDLMRKAQYADDFIEALSEFMQSYNDETMRVYERTKGSARRKLITTQDIEGVVKLVDAHGSKTVCNLLVAFGYARDPKERADEVPTTDEESELQSSQV